jgi:hypothetical protein
MHAPEQILWQYIQSFHHFISALLLTYHRHTISPPLLPHSTVTADSLHPPCSLPKGSPVCHSHSYQKLGLPTCHFLCCPGDSIDCHCSLGVRRCQAENGMKTTTSHECVMTNIRRHESSNRICSASCRPPLDPNAGVCFVKRKVESLIPPWSNFSPYLLDEACY